MLRLNICARGCQIMVDAGPLHARLLRLGEAHMREARQRFLGEHSVTDQPVVLKPAARLLVLRKAVQSAL